MGSQWVTRTTCHLMCPTHIGCNIYPNSFRATFRAHPSSSMDTEATQPNITHIMLPITLMEDSKMCLWSLPHMVGRKGLTVGYPRWVHNPIQDKECGIVLGLGNPQLIHNPNQECNPQSDRESAYVKDCSASLS